MNAHFAGILRGLIENHGLDHAFIARSMSLPASTIDALADGTLEPDAELLDALAPVLGMDSGDLRVIAGLDAEPVGLPRSPEHQRLLASLFSVASRQSDSRLHDLIRLAEDMKK